MGLVLECILFCVLYLEQKLTPFHVANHLTTLKSYQTPEETNHPEYKYKHKLSDKYCCKRMTPCTVNNLLSVRIHGCFTEEYSEYKDIYVI